jgi:hypothetical protein
VWWRSLGDETMSSAEDVEPAVAGGHDDRLTRAFDRVARLGIDLEPDDPISERESAAVRAFTALNLDVEADTDHVPGDAGGPAGSADGARTTAQAGTTPPRAERTVRADPAPPDDAPLRPDAVLQGRRFGQGADRDDERAGGPARRPRPDEIDVPPAPAPAPPATTAAPPAATTATATESPSRLVDTYLLDLVALAVATGAFVTPWIWMFVVAVGALAGAILRSLADHGRQAGAMVRRAAALVLSWLRPRAVAWFAIIAARTVLLAVILPGLVCAAWWVVNQGTDGAFVAGRLGVWAHGLRVAAAAVCFMLVAGVGEAHQRRAALVRQAAGRAGSAAVTALAVVTVLVAASVVALVPRADAGRLAAADGLAWAPVRLRDNIDRVRDDLVSAELHAASGCLSDRQGVTWRVGYTGGNPPGADDVASLSVQDGTPSPAELATAAATLHNQLAPWVERVELRASGAAVAAFDREALPSGRPLVDATELVDGATTGAGVLADGVDGFDPVVALACSAAPIP